MDLLVMMMLVCFASMTTSVAPTAINYSSQKPYDDHMANGLNSLQPHSAQSEDFVLNGRNLLEKGHRIPLWMDVQALLSFKKNIKDPSGKLSNWTTDNSEEACSSWYGITCRQHIPRVVAIILPGLNLTGILSPSIGNFSFLHTLDLSYNNLTGEIPPEIGQLKELRVLNLTGQVTGYAEYHQMLTGSTRQVMGYAEFHQMLTGYAEYHQMLTGYIPKALSNCKSLQYIGFAWNNLTGTIPSEFGHLVELEQLDLGSNSLGGRIPPTLANCTKLSGLDLSNNNFIGTIPRDFGHLAELEQLVLRANQLSDHVPPTLGNCTKLLTLSLFHNNFTGTIPTEFGRLIELSYLDLRYNSLGRHIPLTLGNCTKLQYISLRHNRLLGRLPPSFSSSPLKILDVSENSLTGDLDIRFPVSLTVFKVDSNHFYGHLPPSLTNCSKLQILDLRKNKFIGVLPSFLANYSQLQVLDLRKNNFTGTLPDYITSFHKLQILSMGYNKLQGGIGQWITNLTKLSILDLSNNEFSGRMPSGPMKLQGFKKDVFGRHNVLFYEMEIVLKGVEYLLAYVIPTNTIFDLSNNKFIGGIPASIGSLSSLRILNLSCNQLEGQIPASLGTIETLEEVDLSKNRLSGDIPQELSKLSFLAFANFSSNNLCGPIPYGTQFSCFNVTSFQRNTCLCGFPLPVCPKNLPVRPKNETWLMRENNVKTGWLFHVDENISLIALWIGVVLGFSGVVIVFIAWKKARDWVVPPHRTQAFYGEYMLPT